MNNELQEFFLRFADYQMCSISVLRCLMQESAQDSGCHGCAKASEAYVCTFAWSFNHADCIQLIVKFSLSLQKVLSSKHTRLSGSSNSFTITVM